MAFRFVGRLCKVIRGSFAIDITRDARMVEAVVQLSEIERLRELSLDAQLLLCRRFVHGPYARLDVCEKGFRIGSTAHQEMRFRRAFEKCRKDRSGE